MSRIRSRFPSLVPGMVSVGNSYNPDSSPILPANSQLRRPADMELKSYNTFSTAHNPKEDKETQLKEKQQKLSDARYFLSLDNKHLQKLLQKQADLKASIDADPLFKKITSDITAVKQQLQLAIENNVDTIPHQTKLEELLQQRQSFLDKISLSSSIISKTQERIAKHEQTKAILKAEIQQLSPAPETLSFQNNPFTN